MRQDQRTLHTTHPAACTANAARRSAAGIAGCVAAVIAIEFLRPLHVADPGIRIEIGLAMMLCAIVSAGLLRARFDYSRRRSPDLPLLGILMAVALVEIASAMTAPAGPHGGEPSATIRGLSEALMAMLFAAFALRASGKAPRRTVALAGAGCIATLAITELIAALSGGRPASDGLAAATSHPVSLAVVLASRAMLVASAITFVPGASRGDGEASLLAGASTLLAAATLPYLASAESATNWVTPGDGLRVGAFVLLLAVAARRRAHTNHDAAEAATRAAVDAERRRLARDLHDGLAQDLAFIANYGQRLTSELGPDHPLSIAARRALSATRGAIVDLSASCAPTTGAALRQVAAELAARFDVRVDVRVAADTVDADGAGLPASDRDEVVRIVREAIVNAVQHGRAHQIDVALDCSGARLLLQVSDDGCGMPESVPSRGTGGGFGLATMQARAESLGGHLTARRGALGGTDLEIIVS